MRREKIGSFLKRSKIPIDIKDNTEYKRVTIRINHNGVSLRDTEIGKKIGTKKQFVLKAGQFIVSKIDARYGAFGIAPDEVEGAIITGNFWAYDVDSSKVNIEWFNQFTNSPEFYEICERASSGITHRKYLDEKFFLGYEIPLPSSDEQLKQIEKIKKQRISFGKLTSELSRQSDLLTQLRQSFLREAMQGKLVKQDPKDGHGKDLLEKIKAEKAKSGKKEKELPPIKPEDIPFEIPENWVWSRLGDLILNFQNGISSRGESNGDKVIVLRLADIINNRVDTSNKREILLPKETYTRYLLNKNDILITRVNGSLDIVGNFNYVGSHDESIAACDHFVRMELSSQLNAYYIYLLGKAPHIRKAIKDNFKTTSGQKTVNQGHLSNLLIPLPPFPEQNRIVKKIEELIQLCDYLQQNIQASREQNELLLQQVLKEALLN